MVNFLDTDFIGYISSLDLHQLRECQSFINNVVLQKFSPPPKHATVDPDSVLLEPKDIDDFVSYYADFLTSEETRQLSEELKSIKFNKNAASDKVQNRFISSFNEPYSWPSAKGTVVNNAHSFDGFPVVKMLMDRINKQLGSKLNSVLI